MRRVCYSMTVSMDGYIDSPNAPHGWPEPDETLHRYFNQEERRFDLHLYGRRMYELMAEYWPTAAEKPDAPAVEIEYAQMWNAVEKVVFSTTMPESKLTPHTRLVRDNAAEEVSSLKFQQGQDIQASGATLAAWLLRYGLLDEVSMFVTPHILGAGKTMFQPSDVAYTMLLEETKTFSSGVVLLRYRKG